MKSRQIELISFGRFEKSFLEQIVPVIKTEFNTAVEIRVGSADLTPHFDPSRRQYNANQLIKLTGNIASPEFGKTIGLFEVDLFIPILTFIFGQAEFNGRFGIVSTYRLRNEQYGLAADEKLLCDRLKKVVLHELGHSFGLIHCHVPSCVMRPSTYVEDIDQKKSNFCHKCQAELSSK